MPEVSVDVEGADFEDADVGKVVREAIPKPGKEELLSRMSHAGGPLSFRSSRGRDDPGYTSSRGCAGIGMGARGPRAGVEVRWARGRGEPEALDHFPRGFRHWKASRGINF